MNYELNLHDPRIKSRCVKALTFVNRVSYRLNKPSWLSSRWIHHKDNLGKSGNPLSDYLKDLLLICVDERYSYEGDKKFCKKYIRNRRGVLWLKQQLGALAKPTLQTRTLTDKNQQELATGQFEYMEKASRLNHTLQSFPRKQKHKILAQQGYLFEYDVECCAPTLIHQYAQKCGMDLYLPALREYIANRSEVRQKLSQSCEVSTGHIKSLINMLLFGARIQYNTLHPNDIYLLFEGDKARIEYIRQDSYITQLRQDIATCWSYIKPNVSARYITTKKGHVRSLALSSKRKAGIYRDLERSVGDVWRRYLKRNQMRYFHEHDGFTCEREVDLNQLSNEIRDITGYEVKFDMNKITSDFTGS